MYMWLSLHITVALLFFFIHTEATDVLNGPLNRWPFVGAHDSGTGYLPHSSDLITEVVYRWTRTQNASFYNQLDCGAGSSTCGQQPETAPSCSTTAPSW
jgi:hypothetical protein